ncbi:MAG TPA: hypothetical protein VF337_03665 [Candidatus Limnocylindrales bacterium]
MSGPSAIWCVSASTGKQVINDLSTHTENLFLFANWNDRITSFQTFNETSVGRACLVQDAYFNYSDAHRNSTSQGNQTVNLNATQSDQASSLEVATFNYTCQTT